jgi:hypothetical protein
MGAIKQKKIIIYGKFLFLNYFFFFFVYFFNRINQSPYLHPQIQVSFPPSFSLLSLQKKKTIFIFKHKIKTSEKCSSHG